MPVDRKLYPPNWLTEIRPRILARSGNKCEKCGAEQSQPHPVTGTIVNLQIAHQDHDPSNWEVTDDRLMCLCPRCHLMNDKPESDPRRLARISESLRFGKNFRKNQLKIKLNTD